MKELSIEEKAKRYDEAIERAKSKIKNDKDYVLYEHDIIELFPELAESEDERIRKEIMKFIFNYPQKLINRDSWLAWLEKQGEQKFQEEVDNLHDYLYGEQKPAEWTSEDEEELKIALNTLEKAGEYSSAKWLKNVCLVPQTMQKPAKWSEEDEENIDTIRKALVRYISYDGITQGEEVRLDNWLKSLKDIYTWKPSEEQMEALKSSTYCQNEQMSKVLFGLYQDLKKLREE